MVILNYKRRKGMLTRSYRLPSWTFLRLSHCRRTNCHIRCRPYASIKTFFYMPIKCLGASQKNRRHRVTGNQKIFFCLGSQILSANVKRIPAKGEPFLVIQLVRVYDSVKVGHMFQLINLHKKIDAFLSITKQTSKGI